MKGPPPPGPEEMARREAELAERVAFTERAAAEYGDEAERVRGSVTGENDAWVESFARDRPGLRLAALLALLLLSVALLISTLG